MIPLVLDNIPFEIWGHQTLWSPPSADGEFIEAPADWAALARALACADYQAGADGHAYVLDSLILLPAEGAGVHLPARAGLPPVRAVRALTGVYEGQKVVSILEWDDPLKGVLTTAEAERRFGLAVGSAKKAVQRGQVYGERRGHDLLLRRFDAQREWG